MNEIFGVIRNNKLFNDVIIGMTVNNLSSKIPIYSSLEINDIKDNLNEILNNYE